MGADTSPPQASVYRLSRFSNCKSESLYLNAAIENRASEVLRAWMDRHVVPTFTRRILSIDVAVAQGCAALLVGDPRFRPRCPSCCYRAGPWDDSCDQECASLPAHGGRRAQSMGFLIALECPQSNPL